MAEHVTLVGSRVSVMHLDWRCLGCTNTVTVSITDGKDPNGRRCLIQKPGDCPDCGARIWITVVATPSQGEREAR